MKISKEALTYANPQSLLRLAKFVGITLHDNCVCEKCNAQLVEAVYGKLKTKEPWPPRNTERKW